MQLTGERVLRVDGGPSPSAAETQRRIQRTALAYMSGGEWRRLGTRKFLTGHADGGFIC